MILLICSILCKSGLKPPWQQNIFSSIMAAIGRQLKQSVKVFHSFILYLLLPVDIYKNELDVLIILCRLPDFQEWEFQKAIYSFILNYDNEYNVQRSTYIRRRIHIFCWYWRIRDCLGAGRSSLGIWSYRLTTDILLPGTAFLCQRNHREIDSWTLGADLRIQTVSKGRCTVHVYHLRRTMVNSTCLFILHTSHNIYYL